MEFIDLKTQYKLYKDEIDKKISANLNNASFINGSDVRELENTLAAYVGVKHAVACSNGTDALLIALMAYGIKKGDEIITTPFTFAATAEVICMLGATPVFVDIEERTYNIDVTKIASKITKYTKGIIPVSLYGQAADMDEINRIAKKHGLFVIEDACQSFGAVYKGKKSCALSDVSATSFFPSKPLGCYGDGGMMFTDDDELASKLRCVANHGQQGRYNHVMLGLNFRLDTIQAGILLAKFKHFEDEAEKRKTIGAKYTEMFKGSEVITPYLAPYTDRCVYAQYSIRVNNREDVIKKLNEAGVPTAVHYPMPLHLQPAYLYLGGKKGDYPVSEAVAREIMSLPMHPFLKDAEIESIVSLF
ncbi:MAG: DegT/DnrJ/EryC1/StrS family aminotransferase [Oligoflexia bacterium]|nr:DegT/DnrJ/EryC1/StrS family aminotransferase [Oligoflexia bacterium]